MPNLDKSLRAWGTPGFAGVFKGEIGALTVDDLPLQAGLAQGSYACDRVDGVTLLSAIDTPDALEIRAGLHYAGIIAGCNCADDPTPNNETVEYCEVLVTVDRRTAEAQIVLL